MIMQEALTLPSFFCFVPSGGFFGKEKDAAGCGSIYRHRQYSRAKKDEKLKVEGQVSNGILINIIEDSPFVSKSMMSSNELKFLIKFFVSYSVHY